MRRTRRRRAASLQSRASATGSSRAGASDGLTPLPAAASDGVCVRRHAHQCADGEPRRQSRGAPETHPRDGNDSRRCCHRTRALTLSLDGLAVVRWGDRAARCGGVVAQLLERAAGRGSSSTGFGAPGTLGREGRRAAARTAPARAMLPATRRLPCRLCTNAPVAGAVIRPRPPPPMIICPTSTMYGLEADTVEIHHSASPNIARPVATTALLPILTASLVPTTAATAMDIATGSIRSPVSNAL